MSSTSRLNPEKMSLLVGLLLTDGCVSSSRFVVFHNKSEVMHKMFQQEVSKIFGDVHFTKGIETNGTKRTQVTSKPIVGKLIRACRLETFRRKQFENGKFPKVRLPSFVKNLQGFKMRKFLQVIFTADGSISLSARWHKRNESWEIRRRIELSCKHPALRKDFMGLLEKAGFSPRTSWENITLERKEDILKFAKEVRFVPKVALGGDSKYWKGFEKNEVLDLAVKTLPFSKKDLEKFKTKEEVLGYLRNLM